MSANEPNNVPMSTYDKVRNRPSGPPTRGHDDVPTVVGVPGTTVMAVSLPGTLEVEVVGNAMAEVKLYAPLLPSGRAQLTVQVPAEGTWVSGVLTVLTSAPSCTAPRLTMFPLHTSEIPICSTSLGLVKVLTKTNCSCVGATETTSLGAGFDDDKVLSPAAWEMLGKKRLAPVARRPPAMMIFLKKRPMTSRR